MIDIKLRTLLDTFLSSIHPQTYFQDAPPKEQFPYATFDFSSNFDDGESMQLIVVDIDGWDAPIDGDTTELETLMASIDGDGAADVPSGLNKRTLSGEGIYVTFYLSNKIPLQDPDKSIIRRRYTYQARLFKGS